TSRCWARLLPPRPPARRCSLWGARLAPARFPAPACVPLQALPPVSRPPAHRQTNPPNQQSHPQPFQGRFPLFAPRYLLPPRKNHHPTAVHPPMAPRQLHLPEKIFFFFSKTVPIYTPYFSY